jgi:hypothetical protein
MKLLLLLVLALLYSSGAFAAGARMLAFYEVLRADSPPALDGDLSDACWKNAGISTTYYEYLKPTPGPGVLHSELRMLYDDKGIYLGIVNYDDNLDKIVAERKRRDDPEIWRDDCAEIYFDSHGAGVGYHKFVTNALATRGDMRRIDAAISENNWSANGWRVQTGKTKDAWVIEAFFPWSDLGDEAKAGDLWMFCHVRYAFSSGGFQGVTWAPGGYYNAPENFGFLLFGGGKPAAPEAIGKILSQRVTPPWRLTIPSGFLDCTDANKTDFRTPDSLTLQKKERIEKLLLDIGKLTEASGNDNAEIKKLREESGELAENFKQTKAIEATANNAMKILSDLEALEGKLTETYWQARIEALLETI